MGRRIEYTHLVIEEDDTPPPRLSLRPVPYAELPARCPRTLTEMPDGGLQWITRRARPALGRAREVDRMDPGLSFEERPISSGWSEPLELDEERLPPLRGEIIDRRPQRRQLGR